MSDLFREQRRRDSERSEGRSEAFRSITDTQAIFSRYMGARANGPRPRTRILWGRVLLALLLFAVLAFGFVAALVR